MSVPQGIRCPATTMLKLSLVTKMTHALYGLLYPKPERAAELKQLLTGLIEPTRNEEGCLRYDICESEDGAVLVYEVWQSKADLDRHMASPHMTAFINQFWSNRMEFLTRDIEARSGWLLQP